MVRLRLFEIAAARDGGPFDNIYNAAEGIAFWQQLSDLLFASRLQGLNRADDQFRHRAELHLHSNIAGHARPDLGRLDPIDY